ncbi:hypothetical protein NK55_08090 [Thermosynechococcus sp. NK55a]|jgi:hypothetical protein|uniref:hypothetical protein n=1 Tax=Thermosynechococcus sp. NK55a TaxID=1394889 RepID=UPI0003D83D9E|nr:hypothetical protein [Thermosynechococcus sp. NK55a]AHB88898.1 hypothetical protein NK55_08090 [Thermosynechococcus sp. NK55a]
MRSLNGSWQQQAVAEFFEELNWLGLIRQQPVTETVVLNWQSLKVAEFWQRVNWLGLEVKGAIAPTSPGEWPSYRVRDFFGRLNWEGVGVILPIGLPALAAEITPPATLASSWAAWSVETFFRQLNWEGHRGQTIFLEPSLSLWRLSVKDFCASLPWAGQPLIAQVSNVAAPPPVPVEPEVTLSDLSDLF